MPVDPADPTLEVAERQLAMLGEVARMAMAVTRGCAAAALAASHAVEVILADEFYQPETGRARALAGAKDAADSFQKVSRALRLTLTLEKTVAEWVRDLRAGVVPAAPPKDTGETPAVQGGLQDLRRAAGSCPYDRESDRAGAERNTERLVDIERPDILPRAPFRETVDRIGADLGVAVDRSTWSVGRAEVEYQALQPKPPGWSETRPGGVMPRADFPGPVDRKAPLPP